MNAQDPRHSQNCLLIEPYLSSIWFFSIDKIGLKNKIFIGENFVYLNFFHHKPQTFLFFCGGPSE